MATEIRQIHDEFAGEVSGIDLREPLSAADVATIEAGMDQHAVLVFRNQNITDEQQIAFSKNFGNIEMKLGGNIRSETRVNELINDVSNLDNNNKPFDREDRFRYFNLGNHLWHSDSSFRAVPAKYSLLSGRKIPSEGGNTEFADMRAAYDALDDKTKAQVESMVCEHSQIYSRGKLGFTFNEEEIDLMKPVRQAMVRSHPVSGRKSLYLSAHAGAIIDMPLPEAKLFLMNLNEFATERRFVYAHKWTQYDLVIWDNRQVMHRARGYDETQPRDMRRTTIAGETMTAEQVAA
ncbi:MAG: TauD/TfdA family dioxygenase [Hyphomicrobiaceae bacterium TMED74]|nr:2,4-dichlorophenoxyacetate dioxygenase [Filomicrobium sp.]RPG44436.1 MAG: TauD/TfdA family dioxygenase [Hyphomicrobiaceae bacterium TMED74]